MKSADLTKAGDFKKGTAILKKIDSLVYAYQAKCDSMQIDLNNYSLDDIFKRLKFEEQKEHDVDFIAFARDWVANTSIKGAKNYKALINSIINVSSTNSKQSKLCVKCTLYIDTRLFGKHAVRRNRPEYVYDEIVKASVS